MIPRWRSFAHALLLWLAVASAATHALVPVGSPLARNSGSAFSAFTSDVSLGPSRRSSADRLKRNQASADNAVADGESATPDLPLGPAEAKGLAMRVEHPERRSFQRLEAAPIQRVRSGFQPRAPPLS